MSEESWCYCKLPAEEDDMIGRDDKNCKIGWFHLKCLRITKVPKGKWYCPDCKQIKVVAGEKKRNSLFLLFFMIFRIS